MRDDGSLSFEWEALKQVYYFCIVIMLLYIFPFSKSLCYHTIVLRDRAKQEPEITQRKKVLEMLKEYYESFSHREGK